MVHWMLPAPTREQRTAKLGESLKISINFCTIRSGWLENTFRCLGKQNFDRDEYELVMVDDYGDRWEEAKRLAEENRVNLKYMHSKPYYWKSNRQLGNARNTGFIHTDGELVVFLDDYTWVKPYFLYHHWLNYKRWGKAVIGVVYAVKANYGEIWVHEQLEREDSMDERWKSIYPKRTLPDCPPGWFWTFNASAPLEYILKVQGYDEEFDCTGEDDVDLGLRMSRVGLKYMYTAHSKIGVYHMRHNGGQSRPSPFKPEECHKVTKELYGTKYDGSWGLLERNRRREPWEVNTGYFNLTEGREKRDKYPVKEAGV